MTANQIVTVILSVVSASGILGIGMRAMIARMKKQESRQSALELGVQALLRDRMLHSYDKYMALGYAPVCIKDNFENLYIQYRELGGNGVMVQLHQRFVELPTEPTKE